MIIVHKRGKFHKNAEALSKLDVSATHYLARATEDGFEARDSSNDDEWEGESDDSWDDMSEEERIQFLDARDLFLNEECARIARLGPAIDSPNNTVSIMGNCNFARYSTDGTDTEEEPSPIRWDEPDMYGWPTGPSPEHDVDEQAVFDYDTSSGSDEDSDAEEDFELIDETSVPEQREVGGATEDEVLAEYVRSLPDEELERLLKQPKAVGEDENREEIFGTAVSQWEIGSEADGDRVESNDERTTQNTKLGGSELPCDICVTLQTPVKRCVTCGEAQCLRCLCQQEHWSATQVEANAWICEQCTGRKIKDVWEDGAALYLIKTQQLPLGLTTIQCAGLARKCRKYRWEDEFGMPVKMGSKKHGERFVPAPGDREAIIQEVHKYGHARVNRVANAMVDTYCWHGMQKDVRHVIKDCGCTANKVKATVTAPLKPTRMPIAPFDLVAIDLMSLTRSY